MLIRLKLFYRLLLRPWPHEPVRTLTTIFAVTLGVAVVLAVDLAGNAAAGSFHSSVETLAGDSNLEVTAAGGVPESAVATLVTLPYPLIVRPRIEDHATVADTGESVPLVGVDMVAERASAGPVSGISSNWTADRLDGVWITPQFGKRAGDKFSLLIGDQTRTYAVRGVLKEPRDSESFVLMDIALAQRELGRLARVDRILVKVPNQPDVAVWKQRLVRSLPPGVDIREKGTATEENQRMLAAFRWNLAVLSYIALLVGAFLIYNTISVSVVRRRAELGLVRALGASRGMVQMAFLLEGLCFGLTGTLLGVPLGRGLAAGAVKLVGATVQSLYVSSRPAPIELTASSVLLAVVSAAIVTLASAFAPAREAARVAPIEAMAHGRREFDTGERKKKYLWVALVLVFAGTMSSLLPPIGGKPLFGYAAALLLVAGFALAMPAFTAWTASASSSAMHRLFGVEALLATRGLSASLRRTAVLVAALSTAIAMMVSVSIMVGSFRQTVLIWMDGQLRADLYLRPAGGDASDLHPVLDPGIADRIQRLPGVSGVDRLRAYEASYGGLPVTLVSSDTAVSGHHRLSELFSGRPAEQVYAELRGSDTVLISEPLANKHHLRAGDTISLPLGFARPSFRIVDVFYDYANERGYIALDRATMLRYLPDPALSNIAVYLDTGANLETVRAAVEKTLVGRDVLVSSNRNLRAEAVEIFDRTFAITYALEVVAVAVAVMGVAGALLSLVIDRRREFGLFRFLGAAASQVRKLVLAEAALLGLLATMGGLSLGYVLSLILIYVIDKQSFGWTIRFHWPVAVLAGALAIIYAATVLAAIYPARMAMRMNPIEVVHAE